MSRDYRLYLDDMKMSCEKIIAYTMGMTREEFLSDSRTFDAVVRNLEIIGESTKQIPQELRNQHPGVEWAKAAGLRNLIVHQYFGIDQDIIWDVAMNHIPALNAHLRIILTENPA